MPIKRIASRAGAFAASDGLPPSGGKMKKPYRVLFLCTGNSCRSQMAEGLLRKLGGASFEVFSAGSRPAGFVHPLALEAMREMGIDISGQASKHRDDYLDAHIDIVITLCDAAANEPCPTFATAAIESHWSLPDPTFHPGGDDERRAFCAAVARRLRIKLEHLAGLPLDSMSDEDISRRLSWISSL